MEPQTQEDINDLIDTLEARGWSVEDYSVNEGGTEVCHVDEGTEKYTDVSVDLSLSQK